MKFLKQGPLFFIILSIGFILTIIAIGGKDNIYQDQEYDPFKAPFFSIVLTGIHDEIYPWNLFAEEENVETMASGEAPETDVLPDETMETPSPTPLPMIAEEPTPGPTLTPASYGEGRAEPLRESTREEYLNHISADIYGDVGVAYAATYEFLQVDESYFDDAIFIGDSRTVGLRDYTDLSQHADFYCETSLTIYKVMEEDFKDLGTIQEALEEKEYGKIYLMVGINELGTGTTEDFMGKYTEVVDTLHELEPDAKIIVQGIMRVTGQKNNADKIFNNNNINARNNAIATLADNQYIFYIDVNEVVCDEDGNLSTDYTFDQIHLLGACDEIWKQFLLSHGVS